LVLKLLGCYFKTFNHFFKNFIFIGFLPCTPPPPPGLCKKLQCNFLLRTVVFFLCLAARRNIG
ncbi:hypothetical protein, partial [Anaerotruncus sp.]|uniref:hypothetical protein n=1 Tax=Anaerotruncus sp. TaxID=1872531 RepID=UPI0025C1C1C8